MALKDWKRTEKWDSKGIAYENQRTRDWIQVYEQGKDDYHPNDPWVVQTKDIPGDSKFETHWFKSKAKALTYAKSYMRKH